MRFLLMAYQTCIRNYYFKDDDLQSKLLCTIQKIADLDNIIRSQNGSYDLFAQTVYT